MLALPLNGVMRFFAQGRGHLRSAHGGRRAARGVERGGAVAGLGALGGEGGVGWQRKFG